MRTIAIPCFKSAISARGSGECVWDVRADWPTAIDDDARDMVVAAGVGRLETVEQSQRHRHRKAQLLYGVRGAINCEMEEAVWIVPPGSAIWIPGDTAPYRVRIGRRGMRLSLHPRDACRATAATWLRHPDFRPASPSADARQ
ncbi:hypothetical protein [Brevundimonas sp.]|uniref:hypothetical protein n=1 Tax=Brevundimonas sp. TaxID=1871086 RepID=UPI003B006BF2